MSYFINPVGEDRCVFLSYEGELPAVELSAARYEADALLDQRPCRRRSPATLQRSAGPPPIQLIQLLVNAACVTRGGFGQMSLNDWLDVEQEVKRRLEYEC